MENLLYDPDRSESRMEKFCKSLSDAEIDEAQAIEDELDAGLSEGLPEYEATKFVQTVMAIRKVIPSADVHSILYAALRAGLTYVGASVSAAVLKPAKQKKARSTKTRVRGV